MPPALPPKLEFENHIPEEYKTLVVIPSIFSGKEKVDILVENLEKSFLANKFKNLYFALLSDFRDSPYEETDQDRKDLAYLRRRIRQLNMKHRSSGFDVFYLFHRKRLFNPGEGCWMGWERKRGKLMQLVDWLTDKNRSENKSFSVIDGDISKLHGVRYIITLDEDTSIPADVSLKLIGAMAHPLNFPVLDEDKKIIKRGYGFLQPRIIIKPETENSSPFTKIFVSDSGFDSYSTAISNIYQDVFNRSNFMGKGIFDIRAIKETLVGKFPENALLSHDLLESCFAKAGFLSDTSLVEDFPTSYKSYVSRDNRWVRGDWQLLPWLCPFIPLADGTKMKNPLDMMSLWMILDNLRRSLVIPAFVSLLYLNWFSSSSKDINIYVLVLFFGYLLFEFFSIKKYWVHKLPVLEKIRLSFSFMLQKITLSLTFLIMAPVTAINKILSILRTIKRLITHKKLLEWMTHSEAEQIKNENDIIGYFFFQK